MIFNSYGKIKYSLSLKMVTIFLILVALLLVVLNIFPVSLARNLVRANKESALISQATVLSSSLGALEQLTVDGVSQAMLLLDTTESTRVIVTDTTAQILYDSSNSSASEGAFALYSEISLALDSKVVFYSKYDSGAFISRVAMPIAHQGTLVGIVFIYEYDMAQAGLITAIESTMFQISVVVAILALVLILFFSKALTKRLSNLVSAIDIVRDGEYGHRIEVVGTDEVSELSREFNSMTDRLRETEELRRRFVSDASHELKTPLASIRLLSDSIAQTENMDTETMREFVTDIGNEAERLQRTTEKLLNLTRFDSVVANENEVIDVSKVAENTLRLLMPLSEELKIPLEHNLEKDCPVLASADDVYQVIFNLVENALKYNTEDGYVKLKCFQKNDCVFLTVEDGGIGIPTEDMPHIFDRFYRVDKARSRDAGGSGLGLSIVRSAVVSNGGEIEVCANEPQGTKFTVIFPLHTWEEEQQ